jgi:hypothetical protein
MFQRRNRSFKRIKQLNANPTKLLTHRQQRMAKRKTRLFSALTKKSFNRRVVLRASQALNMDPIMLNRGNPVIYSLPTWKYQQRKWSWYNPSAVPGLIKVQKLKFLALHRRYTMLILYRWMHHRSRSTWVRWLQQLKWNQWAWVQCLEHLPHNLLTKTGWFNHPKEATMWIKRRVMQLNAFPKGNHRVNSFTTQPGDLWSFDSLNGYHQHLSRQSSLWVEQWSKPMNMKHSSIIYV